MLVNFKVSNLLSIEDDVELNLVGREKSAGYIKSKHGVDVVPRAVIFGANATGKTNILTAYLALVDFTENSLRGGFHAQPFIFRNGSDKPTSFTVTLEISGLLYEYEVLLQGRKIYREELSYWPRGRRKRLFLREGLDVKGSEDVGSVKGPKELLVDSVLFLTIGKKYNLGHIVDFALSLQNIHTSGIPRYSENIRYQSFHGNPYRAWEKKSDDEAAELFETRRNKALALLKLADPNITNVNIKRHEEDLLVAPGVIEKYERREVTLDHTVLDETFSFDLRFESRGTKKWFDLVPQLLEALEDGSLVLIDEMDASLHPLLFKVALDLFSDTELNTEGAQLIVTSHNPSVLSGLTTDEVWFTEKRQGSTKLYQLSDFRAREIAPLKKREEQYLYGRYGAVPQVDIALVREVLSYLGETTKDE